MFMSHSIQMRHLVAGAALALAATACVKDNTSPGGTQPAFDAEFVG
jgi:hypothetical protein